MKSKIIYNPESRETLNDRRVFGGNPDGMMNFAEEFVRRTDLTGPLGSGSYGGYMGAMSLGMFAKMLGLDDWIGLLIVPFCGGFAALSDLLM